jgi:hypothetical protein
MSEQSPSQRVSFHKNSSQQTNQKTVFTGEKWMSNAFSICHVDVDNLRHQNGCALWTRNGELIMHGLSSWKSWLVLCSWPCARCPTMGDGSGIVSPGWTGVNYHVFWGFHSSHLWLPLRNTSIDVMLVSLSGFIRPDILWWKQSCQWIIPWERWKTKASKITW